MRKTKNSKIKVIFNLNTGRIIAQNDFDISTKLKDVFSYFEKNYSNKGYKLKKEYSFLNQKIKKYITLSDLLFMSKNSKDSDIHIEVIAQNNINNDNNDNEEIYKTLLFPKINPFELLEYNPSENKIKNIKCSSQIINFCTLYKFSKESAFCNSENELYMSGGLYNGKTLNHFWIVNKKDYQIYKKTMPIFKKYHSMLYIPDNFVLIAGGDSLSTYIYDIENKQFIKWAFMNKKHFQPGLIINGDYVYSFSYFNEKKEEINYFERSDLTSKNPKWEKISPIFPGFLGKNNGFFSLFFGISKNFGDEILILGGEKNKNRYRYNPIVNKIFFSEEKNFEISFWDKTFYNINNKYRIGIPMTFPIDHTLYLLNKYNEKLFKAICSPINNTDYMDVFFDINSEEENEENETGIISIKNNNNSFNNVNNVNNSNNVDNNNDNFIEEEIKFMEDFNKKNDDLKLCKEHNKKEYLFLPNYILNEQLINRELTQNNNEKEIEKEITIYEIFSEKPDESDKLNKKETKKSYLYIPNSVVDDQYVLRQIVPNIPEITKDNKEEIIYIELDQKEKLDDGSNHNNDNLQTKKSYIKKEHFIIPNSALEEQIIDRELLKFQRKKKNIEMNQKNNEDIEENKSSSKISEDILQINYNGQKDEEKNNFSTKSPTKKKGILYVPISSFGEQIIDRRIDMNNNDNKLNVRKRIFKIKVNNNKDDGSDIIKEEEIINELNNDENNNNNRNEENKKIMRNKAKIYIPQYIIEEQVINREIKEN